MAKLTGRRKATTADRAARPGHLFGHRARHPPTAPRAGLRRGPWALPWSRLRTVRCEW